MSEGFYFFSNDEVKWDIQYGTDNGVLIGVGNPQFLHVVGLAVSNGWGFQRVVAVDPNVRQISHLGKMVEFMMDNRTRKDYIEALLCCKFDVDLDGLFGKSFHVHGAKLGRSRNREEERGLWARAVFDHHQFKEEYGEDAAVTDRGLLVRGMPVIGGFDRQCLTLSCNEIIDGDAYPFSAGWGCGYLRDEETYLKTRDVMLNAEYLCMPLQDCIETQLMVNRYHPTIIWTSNILSLFFAEKSPGVKMIVDVAMDLGSRVEPKFPEMQIHLIEDSRRPSALPALPNTRRPVSSHTKAFECVSRHLGERFNLEITNVQEWIDQANGVSNLRNTRYEHIDTLIDERGYGQKVDSIFLHILLGHGESKSRFIRAFQKAQRLSRQNVIVLEHNAESKDHAGRSDLPTKKEIIEMLGEPTVCEIVPGKDSPDRNLLLVY